MQSSDIRIYINRRDNFVVTALAFSPADIAVFLASHQRHHSDCIRKESFMKQKSISFCQGKGSLTHNNREFIAENVDIERMKNNITFVQQPIAEAYPYTLSGNLLPIRHRLY